MTDSLSRLQETIASRRHADPATSYVARLFHQGEDTCLKKVAEETAELIMAAKDKDKEHIIKEAADVCFHLLVALNYYQLGLSDIEQELARREGTSGLVEKAMRTPN
jgi:phosphoribosyl-ATP pyrophosphohydrolase